MIGFTEIALFTVSAFLIVFIKCMDKNPEPIFGIYERKNGRYWFKVAFMYLMIHISKLKSSLRGKKDNYFQKLEKPQELPLGQEKAADIYTLIGANKNGDQLIVNFGKRHEVVDGYFFLKINKSNYGVLTCPKCPDGTLAKDDDESELEFSCEGLKLVPLEPMKKWRLLYKGTMKEFNTGKEHNVKIDGIWTSDLPVYDFAGIEPFTIAQCMAYEKWSKSYFENLKKFKINYYEQVGVLQLKVTVDTQNFDIELRTLRGRGIGDHVDPSQIYKSCIHRFSTEMGDYFRIDQICAPIYGSRILRGFVYKSKESKFYPIHNCSLELYKFGGIEAPPDDYGFSFTAGKKNYTVQVKVSDSPYIYLGDDWKTKRYIKMSNFAINGKEGWGTAEWAYRNIQGKYEISQ